jgi:hypothetical protein
VAVHDLCNDDLASGLPQAVYGAAGESELVAEIVRELGEGPCEVSSLSSRLASRFNSTVRKSSLTPFAPEGRNDGAFKEWLIECGFIVSPPFERNKRLLCLPEGCQHKCANHDNKPLEKKSYQARVQWHEDRVWRQKEESRRPQQEVTTVDIEKANTVVEKTELQEPRHWATSCPVAVVEGGLPFLLGPPEKTEASPEDTDSTHVVEAFPSGSEPDEEAAPMQDANIVFVENVDDLEASYTMASDCVAADTMLQLVHAMTEDEALPEDSEDVAAWTLTDALHDDDDDAAWVVVV